MIFRVGQVISWPGYRGKITYVEQGSDVVSGWLEVRCTDGKVRRISDNESIIILTETLKINDVVRHVDDRSTTFILLGFRGNQFVAVADTAYPHKQHQFHVQSLRHCMDLDIGDVGTYDDKNHRWYGQTCVVFNRAYVGRKYELYFPEAGQFLTMTGSGFFARTEITGSAPSSTVTPPRPALDTFYALAVKWKSVGTEKAWKDLVEYVYGPSEAGSY